MKFYKYKSTVFKNILYCIVGCILTSAHTSAAITVTFYETADGNVEGVLSGSIVLPNVDKRFSDNVIVSAGNGFVFGTRDSLQGVVEGNPSYDRYGRGVLRNSFLNELPDSYDGVSTIGYSFTDLYVDHSAAPGSSVAASGKFIWESNTLDGLGLFYLSSSPFVVYTAADSGDTIQYVKGVAAPEPSSFLMILIGSISLLMRRR